jgi:hypothetical protein
VIFLIGATRVFPWWHDLAGRSLVLIDLFWAVTLLPPFLVEVHLITGQTVFFRFYYAASLTAVAAATLWRLYAITVMRKRGRAAREKNSGG